MNKRNNVIQHRGVNGIVKRFTYIQTILGPLTSIGRIRFSKGQHMKDISNNCRFGCREKACAATTIRRYQHAGHRERLQLPPHTNPLSATARSCTSLTTDVLLFAFIKALRSQPTDKLARSYNEDETHNEVHARALGQGCRSNYVGEVSAFYPVKV